MEAVMRERPDVIIMDIDMPIMGGMEALLRIRQYQAQAGQRPSHIVAYSGNDSTKRHAEFLANGFDRCMHKPSSQQEVLAVLTEFSNNDNLSSHLP
jgi:CheY-like chemotaxis protein